MDSAFLFMAVVAVIGTIAGVIQAIIALLQYFGMRPGAMETKGSLKRTWVVVICMFLTWAAVGFDYYNYHRGKWPGLIMSDIGLLSGNRAYAVVNTRTLVSVAKDHYIMLTLLIEDNQTDLWSDRRIEKSRPFSITGGPVQIEMVPSTPFLLRIEKGQMVDYLLLLMPQNVDADQILSVSHAKQLGGQVLNQIAAFWSQHSLSQTAVPTAQ